jgi:hypothetical protein
MSPFKRAFILAGISGVIEFKTELAGTGIFGPRLALSILSATCDEKIFDGMSFAERKPSCR